jgi:hypothetical protein
MGKFDGVLLVSDYDETLYDSTLTISARNRQAIARFMAQGGRFTVATGRAHRTFTPQLEKERVPFNAPVVLSNGAAIYDYQADRPLVETTLPDSAPDDLTQLARVIPEIGFEAYHGDDIYVYQPNLVTRSHMERVKCDFIACPIGEMPTPWVKVILEQDTPVLQRAQRWVLDHFGDRYEAIFSAPYLLELTAKGATKGGMVARLARHLGIAPDHVYCIGDNQNDIPMLALSAIPFAPANCVPEVKAWGARVLCHCDQGAVAQAIEILDGIY